jgi:site-specific recombinase XerD
MTEDLRLRNYSPKTIDAYTHNIAAFAKHFGKSPRQLSATHIRQYQIFLVEEKKVAWGTFNQIVCALRFFYQVTLGNKNIVEQIPFPRQEKTLPVVLSTIELRTFFNAVDNFKCRTVLITMYGAGLRLSEALGLHIGDIDSDRKLIHVRQGKGKRDRYVSLSPTLLTHLRQYWKAYKPKSWLFPGRSPNHPLSPCSVQKAASAARVKARINKPVTTHTMRHCFATHLLETGMDLRKIQLLLGHGSLNTTALYLHVATRALKATKKSMDLLSAVTEVKNKA